MEGTSREQTVGAPVRQHEADDTAEAHATAEAAIAARLNGLEDRLVEHSIELANTTGYAPYTTTIRAAWVEAVRGLTEALSDNLSRPRAGPRGPQAEVTYRHDPRFAKMRKIARMHRSVGITLELYLGLFKHFRRVYLDALATVPASPEMRARLLDRTLDFFDETELSVTADWNDAGDDRRLHELQARTRSLTLAKDRYVAIFESLRHPAFLLDRSHGLAHANQAALDLFVDASEAGDSLYRHGRRELAMRVEQMLGDVLDPESEPEPTVWIDTLAGRRCFDLRLRPLHDAVENTSLGYLIQLYDVTAYHDATEKAQRAERQMSRFLATMSHEIRTPLHAVLGAADLLRLSEDAARETYIDVIQSAGQSLLQTLNNVLDYSKLENGPPTPRPADIEIAPALQAFCGMAVVGPEAGSTQLSLELSPAVPACVQIDWAMTRPVLTNLVSNALRHDEGGGVTLRVEPVTPTTSDAPMLRFEVTDNGPGLSAEDAETLFRPFEDISARPTAAGGTGLGLAISRYLVSALGGRIDFETTTCGTRIWFDLPLRAAAEATAPAAHEAATSVASGGRCLLVDDDPIGALVTVRQLERAGFTVDRAATLREARAAFDDTAYDAVVVDYLLPDGIGPDLLADLRRSGLAHDTRFVALTANVEALNASNDLRKGFSRVLAKPTDTANLAEALHGPGNWTGGRPDQGQPVAATPNPVRDGLEGRSAVTIAARADAFHTQWSDFRARLTALQNGGRCGELGDIAHRLAGSSAQLGLVELEAVLRELEQRCNTEHTAPEAELIARLNLPLEHAASWRRLQREEAAR